MKKIIAAMLVSCMVLSPAVVMAEESTESTDSTEMTEVNWEEDIVTPGVFEDVIKDGRFVTFDEIAVQMWVPNVLEDVELTDEDKKDGYIGYYQSADGSYAAAVMYVDVKGEDLEAYKTDLEGMDDVSNIADMVINGLSCVSYDMTETDTSAIAFTTNDGYILEFSFAPVSDEDFMSVASLMFCSIMPEQAATSEASSAAESAA